MNADHDFYLYCLAHGVAGVVVVVLRWIARTSINMKIPDTTKLLDETFPGLSM